MKMLLSTMALLAAFVLGGCDHSSNNQPAPAGHGLTITNPTQNSLVEGRTTIAVALTGVGASRVDFFVNGVLHDISSRAPWQCEWNTSGLVSGSYHTISARAYTSDNSYSTSKEVVVRIR